jgi:hypothetical protein
MWLVKPAFFDLHLSAMQHEAALKEGYANAIYPDRVRTLTPARRVETLILWNFPSQLPGLATGENCEPSERKTKSALTYESRGSIPRGPVSALLPELKPRRVFPARPPGNRRPTEQRELRIKSEVYAIRRIYLK